MPVVCVCVCGELSLRGCLHNPHKSPHPLFGLLGKHSGCLSSTPAADTEQIDPPRLSVQTLALALYYQCQRHLIKSGHGEIK